MKSLPLLRVGDALLTIGNCPLLRESLDVYAYDVFVSLLTWEESKELGVGSMTNRWQRVGKIYYHYPIPKGCTTTIECLKCMAEEICQLLQKGKSVHIFCQHGLGRAAMLGVICAMHYNKKPKELLFHLRRRSDLFLRNATQLTSIRNYYVRCIRK
jgi:protein-tyrosine phosphatase